MRKSGKKILGNFFVAFATTWFAAGITGLATEAFWLALVNGTIMGMLSVGNELLDECNDDGTPKGKVLCTAKKALSAAVLL